MISFLYRHYPLSSVTGGKNKSGSGLTRPQLKHKLITDAVMIDQPLATLSLSFPICQVRGSSLSGPPHQHVMEGQETTCV